VPDLKFSLPGPDTFTLTGQTIDKLLGAGDGDAALLYLYILKSLGENTSAQAAAALGISPGRVEAAMAVLSRFGLVQLDSSSDDAQGKQGMQGKQGIQGAKGGGERDAGADKPPEEPPEEPSEEPQEEPAEEQRHYSVQDMKRELQQGSVFYSIVEEAQRSLGKILSPDELMRLFGIYDGLRIAPEIILMLITHCITETYGRRGGRMPTMKYIEKAAYSWEREGIFSLEKAEEYLKASEERKSARGQVKLALQIKDREFSETERKYVDRWIEMGFPARSVGIAYDRTIMKTGKLTWGYMDSIINSWHGKGLHTPKEILDKDRKQNVNTGQALPKAAEQKFGAADQGDIDRMTRILNKIKEE